MSKPLNTTAATALAGSQQAIKDYIDGLSAALLQGGSLDYRRVRNTANELRYRWVLNTNASIRTSIQTIVDEIKRKAQQDIDPVLKRIVRESSKVAPGMEMTALFNLKWDGAMWSRIEQERAGWHNLSTSLWRIADGAQRSALDLIERAARDGTPYAQVKQQLADLLTGKGRANMDYNLRRLWATELRKDRIVAQDAVWRTQGYIQRVVLSRSRTADIECPLCGDAIGWAAGDTRVVPIGYTNLPPYHPWCQCDVRPDEPTADELRAYVDALVKSVGSGLPLPTPPTAQPPAVTQQRQLTAEQQRWLNEQIAHNTADFEKGLKKIASIMKGDRHYYQNDIDLVVNGLRDSFGKLAGRLGMPKIVAVTDPSRGAAYFTRQAHKISINMAKHVKAKDLREIIAHEYGHYLQEILHDKVSIPFMDILQGEARTAIQTAMQELHRYSFFDMKTGAVKYKGVSATYENGIIVDLEKAWRALGANHTYGYGSISDPFGGEITAAFDDLTGEALYNPLGFGHTYAYLTNTNVRQLMLFGGKAVGMAEQEALNQFATPYILGDAGYRAKLDTVMTQYAPTLWRAMRVWIDFLLSTP